MITSSEERFKRVSELARGTTRGEGLGSRWGSWWHSNWRLWFTVTLGEAEETRLSTRRLEATFSGSARGGGFGVARRHGAHDGKARLVVEKVRMVTERLGSATWAFGEARRRTSGRRWLCPKIRARPRDERDRERQARGRDERGREMRELEGEIG